MRRADVVWRIAQEVLATLLLLPLAAFFGFVGYMKATAPLATLARHHAWTVALPETLGRLVGWSEMICALALVLARAWPARIGLAVPTAGALIVNQIAAATVHAHLGETGALPQNLVLIASLAVLAPLARRSAERRRSPATLPRR